MDSEARGIDVARRTLPAALGLITLAAGLALVITYVVSPEFYLRFILTGRIVEDHAAARESQVVEIVTACAGFFAFLLMAVAAGRRWRGPRSERPAAIIVGLIALATFFFVGEELSWGQWIFLWETPEIVTDRLEAPETNLHNIDWFPIRVQSLGSMFLTLMFFVLPFMWRYRWPARLPDSWGTAIAGWGVVLAMGWAFAWRGLKSAYQFVEPDWESRKAYHQFVEQIPEHKEMMVALALLLYGLEQLRARDSSPGLLTDFSPAQGGQRPRPSEP